MNQITGTIQEIQETKTYPKKDGDGMVFVTKLKISGRYFTCFNSPDSIKLMKIGQEVEVTYNEKENEYEGRKFINYNISSIIPVRDITESPKENQVENIVKVGDKSYKISFEEIKWKKV